MAADDSTSIQTPQSLRNRLKQGDDTEEPQEFSRIYGKLVRDFPVQAGLTAVIRASHSNLIVSTLPIAPTPTISSGSPHPQTRFCGATGAASRN